MDSQTLRSIIKSARDEMRKDAGTNTDVDRTPQITWMLFLKCFDDFEKKLEALDKNYKQIIPKGYRWKDWAVEEGNKVLTGPDLIKFVNDDLFPKLSNLIGGKGVEKRDIVSIIFSQITNRIQNGYILRKILNKISKVNFISTDEIHTLADYYEQMLIEMRDAAGSNGEFYTPRPVIRFIVNAINPDLQKSPKILDPACGTGGFMLESLNHMNKQVRTKQDRTKLYKDTVFGIEKKSMPFLLGMMNLLLHEVDHPNIANTNTLGKPFRDITDENQYDVIVTNPPFGGIEEEELKSNLPTGMQTTDTAIAFLLYVMYSLKDNGKCGIILPNGDPISASGAGTKIRKKLIEEFNLHTIIRLPETVFEPYTNIATNILFFDKKGKTEEIWYYEMKSAERLRGITRAKNPNYTIKNPILYEDFNEIEKWIKNKKVNNNAWVISVNDLENYDLDVKNPHQQKIDKLTPDEIFDVISDDFKMKNKIFNELNDFLKKTVPQIFSNDKQITKTWKKQKLIDCIENILGGDWGVDDAENIPDGYSRVKIIRATEIAKWSNEKGKSGVTRLIKKASLEKRRLVPNDIILEVSGGSTTFLVGRSVLIDEKTLEGTIPVICGNFFRRISLKKDIEPKFFHYFIFNFHATGRIQKYIPSKSTNIQNLKVPKFLDEEIVFPSLSTQKQIIQKIDLTFKELENTKKNLLKLEGSNTELIKHINYIQTCILDAAFSGKLVQ